MNPDKNKRPGGGEPEARPDERDDSRKTTPAADMQAEDASTEDPASPDARDTAGGTPAESARTHQTKTDAGR